MNDLPRLKKRTFFGRILQHGQVETVIWNRERCSGIARPVKVKRRKKTGWRAGYRGIRQYRDVCWKPNKPAVVVVQFSRMMRYKTGITAEILPWKACTTRTSRQVLAAKIRSRGSFIVLHVEARLPILL